MKIRTITAPCYTTRKSDLLSFFMVPWSLFSSRQQRSHSSSAWSISPKLSYGSYLSIPASCLLVSPTLSANWPQALSLSWSHHLLRCLDQTPWLALLLGTHANILLTTAQPTGGSLPALLCFSYFHRLLPPGGPQWQKEPQVSRHSPVAPQVGEDHPPGKCFTPYEQTRNRKKG